MWKALLPWRMLQHLLAVLVFTTSMQTTESQETATGEGDHAEYRFIGRSRYNGGRYNVGNKYNYNKIGQESYYNQEHHYGPGLNSAERRQIDVVCLESARNTSWDPMCASDGQTFQNYLAFLCYVRFFNVPSLSVRRGMCAERPEPDYCMFSFVVWRQVCGADNVTYSSPWELMCNAQRTRKPNQVIYDGPCRLRCAMSLMYDPVCGSDGVDYPNPEALRCAAQRDSSLEVAKRGPCKPQAAGAACKRMVQGRGGEAPVCASNGITYASHAAVLCLREHNTGLRIRHDGPCRLPDVDMRHLDAVRVCHFADHTPLWLPVCASNGRTYPNPFVLVCSQQRALVSRDLRVEYAGECNGGSGGGSGGGGGGWSEGREEGGEDEDACRRAAEMPPIIDRPLFCASDGRTYYNHRHYACSVQRDGDWFPYRIVRLNMPCEAADQPCERLRLVPDALRVDPICANDGHTYASPLALMCAMANHEGLRRHHRGQCLTQSEEENGGHSHATTASPTTTTSSGGGPGGNGGSGGSGGDGSDEDGTGEGTEGGDGGDGGNTGEGGGGDKNDEDDKGNGAMQRQKEKAGKKSQSEAEVLDLRKAPR